MRLAALVLAFLTVALAQSPSTGKKQSNITGKQSRPTDVAGWGKVTWGMTMAQVKAQYPGVFEAVQAEQPADAKYVTRMAAKNFKVGDLEMDVSVESNVGSDRASRVVFELPHDTQQNPGATFEDLNNVLVVKYGKPDHEDREEESKTITHSMKWMFRSTTIDLLWIEVQGINFNIVQLLYTAVDKKAVNTL